MNKLDILLFIIWVLVVWALSAISYEILVTVFQCEPSHSLRVMLVVMYAIMVYELSGITLRG